MVDSMTERRELHRKGADLKRARPWRPGILGSREALARASH